MSEVIQKPKTGAFKRKRNSTTKKKIKKLFKYLRSELGSSTTHGLPYVVNIRLHWFERLFWLACIVLSAVVIFVLISAQYAKFLAAPSIMSMEMDYFNWNVSFPAITLCPLNKNGDELRADVKYLKLLYSAHIACAAFIQTRQDMKVLGPYLESIGLASMDSLHLLQVPAPDLLPLINTRDYSKLAAQIFRKFNFTLITDSKLQLSSELVMTEIGMCHAINSNVAVYDNPSKWIKSGRISYTKNNLEITFYDGNFYVHVLNYADSYKVFTHSPDDIILIGTPPGMPFDDAGVLSFEVQMTSIKASSGLRDMALHLRKCRFVDEPDSRRYPVYSFNRCLMECRIRMIKIFCGCVPHFYKPLDDEKVCNIAELKCLVDYKKQIDTLSTDNETISKFGHAGLPRNFRDCNCLEDCELEFYNKDSEKFEPKDNVNRLKVILAAFPKVRILREIIFSFSEMMLRSGSIINLCIGTSLISVIELLMTVLRILIYQLALFLQRIWTKYKIFK